MGLELDLLIDHCDAVLAAKSPATPPRSRCTVCDATGVSLVLRPLNAVICLVCGTTSTTVRPRRDAEVSPLG
jgi:hypothetical protein